MTAQVCRQRTRLFASITGLASTFGGEMLAAISGGRGAGYFGIALLDAGGRLDPAFGEGGFGTRVHVTWSRE